jgi:diguanylate cyclase (GGDEF)-like protein
MAQPSMLSVDQLRDIIEIQAMLVAADFDLANFMNSVVERVVCLTPAATGAVIELIEAEEMVCRAASSNVSPYLGSRIRIDRSLSGVCVTTGQIKVSADTATDPRVDAVALKKVSTGSMAVVPLFRKERTIGVLKVLAMERDAFDEHHLQTLELMAGMLGGALGQQLEIEGRQKLEVELRRMAHHDYLTGLPNRLLFNDRLAQAIIRSKRNSRSLALMYIDFDHFKSINDTHGHAAGDAVLKAFAVRVSSSIRASDTLARLGGDEFALIAEGVNGKPEAEIVGRRIVISMSQPIVIEATEIRVGTSIGIALSDPARTDEGELLRHADRALYAAKEAGRGTYRVADCH